MTDRKITFRLSVEEDAKNAAVTEEMVGRHREADAAIGASRKRLSESVRSAAVGDAEAEERASSFAADKWISRHRQQGETIKEQASTRQRAARETTRAVVSSEKDQAKAFADGGKARQEGLQKASQGIQILTAHLREAGVEGVEQFEALGSAVSGLAANWGVVEQGIGWIGQIVLATKTATAANVARGASVKATTVSNIASYEAERLALNRLSASGRGGAAGIGGHLVGRVTAGGAGVAVGKAATGGTTGLAGFASTVGAALGALVGLTGAATVAGESLTGAAMRADSWTMAIAKAEVGLGQFVIRQLPQAVQQFLAQQPGSLGATARAEQQQAIATRREQERLQRLGAAERLSSEQAIRLRREFAQPNRARDLLELRRELASSPEQQKSLLQQSIRQTVASIRSLQGRIGGSSGEARDVLLAEQERRYSRLASQARDYQRLEQQALNARKEAANEAIRAATVELEASRRRVSMAEDEFKSGARRFGGMNPVEQAKSIFAIRKARAGGALSDEQRELLRRVGTRQARSLADRDEERRGMAAGFGRFFGVEERRTAATEAAVQRRLNLEVADKRQITARLEMDESRMVDQVTRVVTQFWSEQAPRIEAKLAAQMRSELERLRRQSDAQLAQKRLAAGGGR